LFLSFLQTFEDHIHPIIHQETIQELIQELFFEAWVEWSYNLSLSLISIDVSDFCFAPPAWRFRIRWYQSSDTLKNFWCYSGSGSTILSNTWRTLGFLEISSTKIRDEFSWRREGWCDLKNKNKFNFAFYFSMFSLDLGNERVFSTSSTMNSV